MRIELTEMSWLQAQGEISLQELAEQSGLSETELDELVNLGALAPVDPHAAAQLFRAETIVAARTACRLRNDFELDVQGLALVLSLLDRIHDLEAQVCELRARLPGVFHM